MGLEYQDNITPQLRKLIEQLRNPTPVLRAMGAELVSITRQSFEDAALRAAPWPPKKDGTPATLKKTSALQRSIRIVDVTNDHVTVGTDRIYAAIHQLGGIIKVKERMRMLLYNAKGNMVTLHDRRQTRRGAVHYVGSAQVKAHEIHMPARPFFPFKGNQMTPLARERLDAIAQLKITAMLRR